MWLVASREVCGECLRLFRGKELFIKGINDDERKDFIGFDGSADRLNGSGTGLKQVQGVW